MKLFIATIVAPCLLGLSSCTPKPDIFEREVSIPKDPEHEKYYVKTTSLYKQLITKGQALLKFQFRGSDLVATPHNESQARAIAWATKQADLINDQFEFTLVSNKATHTQREPLLRYLSNNGVRLQQIQIGPVSNSNPNVVDDLVINNISDADLITVSVKRLR
jgi:hypothetical protein